jgi:hypothetical protein
MDNPFLGHWRIIEAQGMDLVELDQNGEAMIEFGESNEGKFRIAMLNAGLDYRLGKRSAYLVAEFSWDGDNAEQAVTGRGWVTLKQDNLVGRLFLHHGTDYSFVATRRS